VKVAKCQAGKPETWKPRGIIERTDQVGTSDGQRRPIGVTKYNESYHNIMSSEKRKIRSASLAAALGGLVVLLTYAPLASAAQISLSPAYNSACGDTSNVGTPLNSANGTTNSISQTSPSLTTGDTGANIKVSGSTTFGAALSGHVDADEFFFITPTSSGCWYPGASGYAWDNFTWSITYVAAESMSCAGGASGTVTGSLSVIGAIHLQGAGYLPKASTTVWSHSINCSSFPYNSGTVSGSYTAYISREFFNNNQGYDFFSNLYEDNHVSISGGIGGSNSASVSIDVTSATFSAMSCHCG
jgi:hypothetical protein